MQHKTRFRLISAAMGIQIFLSMTFPAQAGLFSKPKIPSASSQAADIERRYHIDPGAVQQQGETMNVAEGKTVTPEVSLFFSPSDPKSGEKVTARSFPTYFTNDSSRLYFTWFLQRRECAPGQPVTPQCDLDSNGRLDHNDWKIMAHRLLASNDLDLANVNYSSDTDNDGYSARFGGDNRVNVPNHCYFHDNTGGENYEISNGSGSINWGCSPGLQPVCMVGDQDIDPATINLDATGGSSDGSGGEGGSATASGSLFTLTDGTAYVSGFPFCRSDTAGCSVGVPCCVANPAEANSCEETLTTCSGSGSGMPNPICRHLFPVAPGYVAGDGTYGVSEEEFWQTDSNDPDTADNGNKDEANIVGLGQDTFTWNYFSGDRVGVAIEGTSMIPTKHNDSSNAIMWAFSKNRCPLQGGTGSYIMMVKGYQVIIPTVDMDLNDCIADNLVDPSEGGQVTNLEMTVTASPEDPLDDVTGRGDGDTVEVVATGVDAAQNIQNIYYDWRVELSSDGTSNPVGGWVNITAALNNLPNGRKLLSQIRGNGVNRVQLNMNMLNDDVFNGRLFSTYLLNNIGYLRFRVDAAESFNAAGAIRRGRSNVIVKFNATQDRILAHTVNVSGDPARVSLDVGNEICSGVVNTGDPIERQALTRLDGKLCRVIRNEIIGLEVPGADLTNFNWTINGQPLVCNSKVSNTNCFDDRQGNINFFPVIGNTGDTFNITVTANRINSVVSAEKTVTISRAFKIVQPDVSIAPADQNSVWQKLIGRYIDTNGTAYSEYSKDTLETIGGNIVSLRALFTPDFLGSNLPPKVERAWSVDGEEIGDGGTNTVSFTADKGGKAVYNVSLTAVYRPNSFTRQAMEDIWGLSALDTTEIYFSNNTQIEQPDTAGMAYTGAKKYYALIANYLPGSVLFSLKVLFSAFLILFASGVVFAIIPNVPEPTPAKGRYRKE